MSRFKKFTVGLLLTVAAIGLMAFVMDEHKFKGFTAEEYFPDPQLVVLAKSACVGDVATIKKSVSSGVDINGTGRSTMTPLIWAIHCQNISGITALLEAGANPNQKDKRGATPFLIAIDYDNQEMLGLLMKHGANLYEIGNGGMPVISLAFDKGFHGKWANYYYLMDHAIDINYLYEPEVGSGDTVAMHAVRLGRFDKVIELIDRGYNRNLGDVAVYMHIHQTSDNLPAWGYKQKLIAILKARGVPYDKLAKDFDAGERRAHPEQY